jgi:uncharacterized protein
MAAPISQYVLKVHGWCNLACDHCYVYEHADQSWRAKPRIISPKIAAMAAKRISEHAAAHRLKDVCVVLHGGEPLLLGKTRMRALLDALISGVGPVADIDLRIQSNGILLDEEWCDLFREYRLRVGVSLDGDKTANDLHRKFVDGRSSYSQVVAGLTLLRRPEYRHTYAGILCTIDLANDPVTVYQALAAQEPPNLDLLLPHATWEHPPYRPIGQEHPYADWLMQFYWCWDRDGRRIPIRIFNSMLSAARGGVSFTEALGTDPADLLVIDTNGDWEQADSMKTAFDGAAATGMNVFDNSVDEVCAHPAIAVRQGGVEVLSAICRACPVVNVCGGGLYAHRFRPDPHTRRRSNTGSIGSAEFNHPSVYCTDLKALIIAALAAERGRTMPITARTPADRTSGKRETRPIHTLPAESFESLTTGPGDVASVDVLASMRLSEARSLVAMVAASEAGWRDMNLRAAAAEGWTLLRALSRDHPREVDEVLAHPYVYAWAVRCLRPPPHADIDLDRAHLAGVAAAAAFHAGISAELSLPIRGRYVHLPTVGAIVSDPSQGGRTQIIRIMPGQQRPVARGSRWRSARYLCGPPFRRLVVEDLDPFRDCQGWPASGRLSSPEWRRWRRDLTAAEQRLVDKVPGYARALAAGLRAVVPLRSVTDTRRSATARQAFGAVAIARLDGRAQDSELSELLLHEFQHVKLNVLLDMHVLFHPECGIRFHVPWRADPRPVEGVLHGIYAFLALTHLRRAEGPAAHATYLVYRSWVFRMTDELLRTRNVLTSIGERFVNGMAVAAESEVT